MGDSISGRARRETLVGQIVDGHELVRVIAAGGMGEVYLARHLRLGVQRAIKVIREDQRAHPAAGARFVREAQVLSHLQHNSIVQIVEFGELPSGWPFLVMEYVDGPNLDQVVEARGPLGVGDALVVLEQIASALAYAHAKGVVHRDLKPANVLVRGGDFRQVKVIDFGLAHTVAATTMSRLTAEGQMMGSPLYMAPEQADGSLDVTAAVDAYALAGVAYALLSGKPVFPGLQLVELICAHATEVPPHLRTRRPELPQLLDDLMYVCLAKDPATRPHVDELASHLGRLARATSDVVPGRALANEVAFAATISASSKLGDSEIARMLSTPPPDDGMSAPLLNQLIALVEEIATTLSAQEADLARLLDTARRTSDELTELEMDLAVLDAKAEQAPMAARSALDRERAVLAERVAAIRTQVIETQRRLASKIDGMRAVGNPETSRLFADLDDVMSQLRSAAP